ncbi:endonuclease domain-containing protein [Nonomuraea fuscirosea]|uniref:endonuclease domain-containing protein n=1 Tax=Nonomuraea fuscirosea TaxID=1291556 RepID=UPI00342F7CB6
MNQPSSGHPRETPPSSTGPRPPSLTQRAARITRALPQVVACRQTAAHIWGLQVLPAPEADWPVELTAPGHLVIPGCVTYLAPLPDEDIAEHNGVRITTMERTALDCARWLPRMEAVAIVDQFARKGIDLAALWHRPLNSWRLRDTLSLADRGAASPRESWLRVLLIDGGLPRPTTQIRVALAEDRFAYLDMGWEEFKVAVEYDGQQHHTSAADQQRDADRREELRRRGWRVIAVRRDVIPGHIADLLHHVADALIERGWRPGPHGTNRILSRIRAARRSSRFRLPTRPTTPGHSTHQARSHRRTTRTADPKPHTDRTLWEGRRDDVHPMRSPLQHDRCGAGVRYGDYAARVPAAIASDAISIALLP